MLALEARAGRGDDLSPGEKSFAQFSLAPGWNWYAIPLAVAEDQKAPMSWMTIRIDPPWNPGLSNFPEDLGVRIHALGIFAE